MSNKVLVLKRNASVDVGELQTTLDSVLSGIMKYDFTKPITSEEDNQALKKIVANARKEWKSINDEKIAFKKAILEPFDNVDTLIKDYKVDFDNKLNQGAELSKEYEDNKKLEIENEVKEYFRLNNKHTFITFDQVGINITLSASMKSYKDTIDKFLSQIETDLQVINTQDNKERVLSVYYDSLNLSQAITSVTQAIEREQQLVIMQDRANQAIAPTPEIKKEIEEVKQTEVKKYITRFEMTELQVAQFKEFMISNNIKYDLREALS